jgi:hypothetical protein
VQSGNIRLQELKEFSLVNKLERFFPVIILEALLSGMTLLLLLLKESLRFVEISETIEAILKLVSSQLLTV